MKLFLSVIFLVFSFSAFAEDVFRIQFEKDSRSYSKYSNKELRRRVWELERAVFQLQQQVFHLQGNASSNNNSSSDVWVCKVKRFSNIYSATGASKAVATHKLIEKCTQGEKSGFGCDNVSCEK